MKTTRTNIIKSIIVCFVAPLLAGMPSRAGVISVKFIATSGQAITGSFGITNQGTVVGGWVNLLNVTDASSLPFSDGASSTVNLTGSNPGGFATGNAAYAGTPLNSGKAIFTGTSPHYATTTLSNLNANFPNGYKVIAYLGGYNANNGASISVGTTTYYYQPVASPSAPVTFVQTTQTTDLGDGNAPERQYAVFGNSVLLTNDTLTLTNTWLYGGGAYFSGFQIVGTTALDQATRIWKGNLNSDWETSSLNWTNDILGATNYADGNLVIFNDAAVAASPTVNLTATRSPSSVTVDSTKNYTFSGNGISGATGLTKKNSGTLTLNNANTYTGATAINSGVLKIGAAGAIPDGAGKGDVTIAVGATLDLNGVSEGINGLSGAGTLDNTGGTATLTVGLDNDVSSFGGTIQGAVSLAKQGTNSLTLSGISSHAGATLVQQGSLSLNPVSSFSGSSALVVSNGATLALSIANGSGLFSSSSVSLNGGTALTVEYGNASTTGSATPITTSGALNLNGGTQIGISGNNFAVGTYTLLSYGSKTGGGSISATPAFLPAGVAATITNTGSAINLVVTSAIQSLLWTAGDGNWATNAGTFYWNLGTAEYKEYPNGLGDAVQFDTSNFGTVSIQHDVHPYSVIANGNYVITGPGRITGATGIEKVGSTNLTFILSSANSYDGITKVTQGTLLVTHANALGSTVGATTVTAGGSLALSNGIVLSGEPLLLSGDGVSSGGALRSLDTNSPVTVASDITLAADARIRAEGGDLSLTGKIADGGSNSMLTLHAAGVGIVHLNSSSNSVSILRTYGFNLNGGRVVFGAQNVFPTARLWVGGGRTDVNGYNQIFADIENGTDSTSGLLTNSAVGMATLTVSGTNVATTTVPLAGPIQIVKTGAGLQSLNGTNTYSGTTTVNAGVLRINGNSSGATNLWTVSGGEFQGSGIIGGPVSVGASGTLSPGAGAVGTLTLNGNLALTGRTLAEVRLSGGGANDLVVVGGNANYGGALVVTNVGLTELTNGSVFHLFTVTGSKNANFSGVTVVPDALTGTFDPATGNVTLSTVVARPTLGYTPLGGGVFQLSWTGAFKLQWQTNALAVGLGTNWVDYPGGNTSPVNVTNSPAIPTAFFRLSQ